MTLFDLLVIVALGASGGLGWYRGGLREAVTLIAIAAGFLSVTLFGAGASSAVSGLPAKVAVIAALFVVADLAVSIVGGIAIRRFVGAKKGRNDRIAGALFGTVRGWVLSAFVLLTIIVYHDGAPLPPTVDRSLLAPLLEETASRFLRKADVTVTQLSNGFVWPISPSTGPAGA